MKIHMDMDCTPEELRSLFGLPDVKPMQGRLLEMVEERVSKGMGAMDPEVLMKIWFPAGIQGLGELQRAFWSRMTGSGKDEE